MARPVLELINIVTAKSETQIPLVVAVACKVYMLGHLKIRTYIIFYSASEFHVLSVVSIKC